MNVSKIAFVLVASCIVIRAGEITVNNVTYTASNETIKQYQEASKAFETAQKKAMKAYRAYTAKTMSPDEYFKIARIANNARHQMLDLELGFKWVPTITKADPKDLAAETMQKLFKESEDYRERLSQIKGLGLRNVADHMKYLEKLKKIAEGARNHPIRGHLLLEVGNWHGNTYEQAVEYYSLVLKCRFPSDTSDSAKIRACYKLARCHESNSKYKEAIAAIRQMNEISNATTKEGPWISHLFWIWRLSLGFEKVEKVRADMWRAIATGKATWPPELAQSIADQILTFYDDTEINALHNDLTATEKILKKTYANTEGKKQVLDVFDQTKAVLELEARRIKKFVDLVNSLRLKLELSDGTVVEGVPKSKGIETVRRGTVSVLPFYQVRTIGKVEDKTSNRVATIANGETRKVVLYAKTLTLSTKEGETVLEMAKIETITVSPTVTIISKKKACELATAFINKRFEGHSWGMVAGGKTFQKIDRGWYRYEIKKGRIYLMYGGKIGQEFNVSMDLDGTDVKLLHAGYAVM